MEPRKSNLIFETEEDEFINPPRRGRTGELDDAMQQTTRKETTKPTMSYDEWLATKRPEEDFLDLESDVAKMVSMQQEGMNRAKEPSALQKKYEEMGLEYDYTKRKEGESPYTEEGRKKKEIADINEYRRVIEQENPDFLKRNDASDMVENISEQLKNQYDKEMGRLNAIEVSIIANPNYSGTEYARGDMQLLRLREQQIKDFYEAEKAKLDGQYYESLPPKDMNVANMLLGQGITGNQLTYLTKNHGNIRDTINENLLYIPEDKKEEFKTKMFGDYVRDDQGNIVRNALGEELRKGGELITVTPQGTYDYTISPTAFSNGIVKIAKTYGVGEGSTENTITSNEATIKRLKEAKEAKSLTADENKLVDERIRTLSRENAKLQWEMTTGTPFINELPKATPEVLEATKDVVMEQGKFNVSPTIESTPEATTPVTPKATGTTQLVNIDATIERLIQNGILKRDANGKIVQGRDTEDAKRIYQRLKDLGGIK